MVAAIRIEADSPNVSDGFVQSIYDMIRNHEGFSEDLNSFEADLPPDVLNQIYQAEQNEQKEIENDEYADSMPDPECDEQCGVAKELTCKQCAEYGCAAGAASPASSGEATKIYIYNKTWPEGKSITKKKIVRRLHPLCETLLQSGYDPRWTMDDLTDLSNSFLGVQRLNEIDINFRMLTGKPKLTIQHVMKCFPNSTKYSRRIKTMTAPIDPVELRQILDTRPLN